MRQVWLIHSPRRQGRPCASLPAKVKYYYENSKSISYSWMILKNLADDRLHSRCGKAQCSSTAWATEKYKWKKTLWCVRERAHANTEPLKLIRDTLGWNIKILHSLRVFGRTWRQQRQQQQQHWTPMQKKTLSNCCFMSLANGSHSCAPHNWCEIRDQSDSNIHARTRWSGFDRQVIQTFRIGIWRCDNMRACMHWSQPEIIYFN